MVTNACIMLFSLSSLLRSVLVKGDTFYVQAPVCDCDKSQNLSVIALLRGAKPKEET